MFGEFATQRVFHRCVLGLAELLATLSSEALGDVNHIKKGEKKKKKEKKFLGALAKDGGERSDGQEARGRKRSP